MLIKASPTMFLIVVTALILTTVLLWSTAVAQEAKPTTAPEPTSLPAEVTDCGIQGFSSSGVSAYTENECIHYVEDGTDDAGPVVPYPPVSSFHKLA